MNDKIASQLVKTLNETFPDRQVKSFNASERLALIALEPFLELIGGRIALILDMAINKELK